MAHVMRVWTGYHPVERTISSSPPLAAVHYAEQHGIEEASLTIFVRDLYTETSYEYVANQLNYDYAPDGGYAR